MGNVPAWLTLASVVLGVVTGTMTVTRYTRRIIRETVEAQMVITEQRRQEQFKDLTEEMRNRIQTSLQITENRRRKQFLNLHDEMLAALESALDTYKGNGTHGTTSDE